MKWTRKMPRKFAELVEQDGIPVSANTTVGRLLHKTSGSLRANYKKLASDSSPFRGQQFQDIASLPGGKQWLASRLAATPGKTKA